MKKFLLPLILIAALAGFSWIYFFGPEPDSHESAGGPGATRQTRAVPVEATEIRHETIRDVGRYTGSLKPSSRFVISPKINGRLEELRVDLGDRVNNGDLIAVLDNEEHTLAVSQAEAELAVARANLKDAGSALEIASREFERTRELREQRVASEAELDSASARFNAAEAAYAVSRAHIQQREAALESARVRLSYTRIHALWSGGDGERIVSEKFIDEGNMLRANDPVVSIVDVSTIIARVHVIERDFPHIRTGQVARVTTDAWPDNAFEGRIVRKAPVLAEASRQATVEIEIPNPDFLLAPGMYVRASIRLAEIDEAVVVPESAIVRRDGVRGVFLADREEQTAAFVPVETGITEEGRIQIKEPALSGEVVTLGQHLLEDGAAIRIAPGTVEVRR